MPTARPSITPRTGVVVLIANSWLIEKSAAVLIPTAKTATNIGIPAAMSDPSVINNTTSAITTPPISPGPKISLGPCSISAPPDSI